MSQMVAYPPTCAPGSPEQIEEERRVLGVAMTRAKLHLHLIEPPPGITAESPRFDCGNLLWLENELSPHRVKDHYAGCFLAVVNEDIRFAVNLDPRSAIAIGRNGFCFIRSRLLSAVIPISIAKVRCPRIAMQAGGFWQRTGRSYIPTDFSPTIRVSPGQLA